MLSDNWIVPRLSWCALSWLVCNRSRQPPDMVHSPLSFDPENRSIIWQSTVCEVCVSSIGSLNLYIGVCSGLLMLLPSFAIDASVAIRETIYVCCSAAFWNLNKRLEKRDTISLIFLFIPWSFQGTLKRPREVPCPTLSPCWIGRAFCKLTHVLSPSCGDSYCCFSFGLLA